MTSTRGTGPFDTLLEMGQDWLHKLSTKAMGENQAVVLEEGNVAGRLWTASN